MKPSDFCETNLKAVFDLLMQHYGPRHWWPADSPFEVVVGTILTQQVAWRNVTKAIDNLKQADALSPEALLSLPDVKLWELIRPTRFYRQKGVRLQTFCRMLVTEFSSDLQQLFSLELSALRRRLLAIPGIGKETADSIILYAAGKPVFVIDAYTHRIFKRLGLIADKASYDTLQSQFMSCLPHQTPLFNEYHALIDGLGHHLCLNQRPQCRACPLDSICAHRI